MIEAEDLEIPPPLVTFARLLLLSPRDWEKAREKQKLPKPKLSEEDGPTVLEVINQGLQQRLAEFPSSIEVIVSVPCRVIRLTYVLDRLGASLGARSSTEETERDHSSSGREANTVADVR